ncbi:ABC transporter substrate-binding protein [Thermaerobacter subterraneus]|uniref:Carbohydrate ABC transporter substrate-binding protein, CUT1 family n=1 Tax=Thermaerobacter subterraneus DSM 13965 TaxID=867903 RepID=K6Q2U9_9FIRM|nr:sugar ABC transporter substrate-binding protein [Thermaerobacter subterraneus]EKP95548.1 carbohydrate ABC transporter substrate-binding protein, CUT1 family [Thermaerobacter subterraneus DSM 13965]
MNLVAWFKQRALGRWARTLTVLLATAVLATGCSLPSAGGGQPSGSTGSSEPAAGGSGGEKVTIRLATWAHAEEAKELQAILDRINAESDRWQIVHEPIPSDYATKIQTMLAGNTAPDLFWLVQEDVIPFAASGVLLKLDEHLQNDSRPAANLGDYFEPILGAFTHEGGVYGLPWIAQPVVLYYNKALFDEAGVPYPDETWTWDTFKEAAAKLTRDTNGDGKPDVYGFTMNGWPPFAMFAWQAGGDIVGEDGRTAPIDSPEALEAARFYQELIYNPKYAVPEEVIAEQGFADMFKAGKVAMFMGGASDDLDRVPGLDVGVAPVPSGPAGRVTFAWTAATVVNARSPHVEEAVDALIELTEGIHHWKIVAPRKSLATREHLLASEPRKEKAADVILQSLEFMRPLRIVPQYKAFDQALWEQYLDPLFHKQGKPEELAPKVRPELEKILQQSS